MDDVSKLKRVMSQKSKEQHRHNKAGGRPRHWPFEARDAGEYEMGVIVSGSWAPLLLSTWAEKFGGEREAQVVRLRLGPQRLAVKVTAWDLSQTRRSLLPLWAKKLDILIYARGRPPDLKKKQKGRRRQSSSSSSSRRRKKNMSFEEVDDDDDDDEKESLESSEKQRDFFEEKEEEPFRACEHSASSVLEELLPCARPLCVVAIVDTSETGHQGQKLRERCVNSSGPDAAAERLVIHASLLPPTDGDEAPRPMEDRCGDLLAILCARRLHMLQAHLVVSVPRYLRVGEPPATFYEVRCELRDDANVGWTNPRRYRDFEALYADLLTETPCLPPLPPARRSVETVFSKMGFANENHLERRRKALDTWLRSLVATPKADDLTPLTTFLDPGNHLKTLMLRKRTHDPQGLDRALEGNTPLKEEHENQDNGGLLQRRTSSFGGSSSVAVDDELYFGTGQEKDDGTSSDAGHSSSSS